MDKTSPNSITAIQQLIAKGQLNKAIQQLQFLFENSPKLAQAIAQAGRFKEIHQQIMDGTISKETELVEKNKIRKNILDLLTKVNEQAENPAIQKEIQAFEKEATIIQKAEKIYNIQHIDKANFN